MVLTSEVITDNVAYFRDEAEKCLTVAEASDNPGERAQWTQLAQTYRRLARQLEAVKSSQAGSREATPIGADD